MKEKPIIMSAESVKAILAGRKSQTRRVIVPQPEIEPGGDDCPYKVGAKLWVRETWAPISPDEEEYKADSGVNRPGGWNGMPQDEVPEYARWHSPIYMPRWASRITLEITNVRVERVQEITNEDAKAEGMRDVEIGIGNKKYNLLEMNGLTLRDAYMAEWDALNAKRGYSWSSNPWVWVIEFKVVE